MKSTPSPRGRRPGKSGTRERILDVAQRRFIADGYTSVTLRSIADEAGVDAALVSYFFGSKSGLFVAAIALAANPVEILSAALPGDLETLPERLLTGLLRTWDDPTRARTLRAVLTAAVTSPEIGQALSEAVTREIVARLADYLGGPHARLRATAVATQFIGILFARYILEVEPVASMAADELVRAIAPGMRLAVLAGRGRGTAAAAGQRVDGPSGRSAEK